jgi:hypothetical protein
MIGVIGTMIQTVIVQRRSGLEIFEWLIECIKSLGYTIGEMEISRLHSSCRFDFEVFLRVDPIV